MSLTFDGGPHIYRWRGEPVPSVTQVMRVAGLGPDYSEVPWRQLERKAVMGTLVHDALDATVRDGGGLDPEYVAVTLATSDVFERDELGRAEARVAGYYRAGVSFLDTMGLWDGVVASEERLYSEVFGYAGTLDLLAMHGTERALFDWKTTAVIHERAVGAQTAAYRVLWNERNPMRKVGRRFAVQLRDDGTFRLHPLTDPADERRWLEVVTPDGEDAVLEQARRMVTERAAEFI